MRIRTVMEDGMKFTAKVSSEIRQLTGEGILRPEYNELTSNYVEYDYVVVNNEWGGLEKIIQIDSMTIVAIDVLSIYILEKSGDSWKKTKQSSFEGYFRYNYAVASENILWIFNYEANYAIKIFSNDSQWQFLKVNIADNEDLMAYKNFADASKSLYNMIDRNGSVRNPDNFELNHEAIEKLKAIDYKKFAQVDIIPSRTSGYAHLRKSTNFLVIAKEWFFQIVDLVNKSILQFETTKAIKEVSFITENQFGILMVSGKSEFYIVEYKDNVVITKKVNENHFWSGNAGPDFNSFVVIGKELVVSDCMTTISYWDVYSDYPSMTGYKFLGYGWGGNMVKLSENEFCVNFAQMSGGFGKFIKFFRSK